MPDVIKDFFAAVVLVTASYAIVAGLVFILSWLFPLA